MEGCADTPPGQAHEPAAASHTNSGRWRTAEASAGRSQGRGSERSIARKSVAHEESASAQGERVQEYSPERQSSRTHGLFIHTAEDRPVGGALLVVSLG